MLKRVSQALATGAAPLPSAERVAVFDPPTVPDVSEIPAHAIEVITHSAILHAACTARGMIARTTPEGSYDAALVILGRSRPFSRVRIAQAAACVRAGGVVLVDGQKTDGVEPAMKDCAERALITDSYVKSHGRLFWFDAGADFSDWAAIATDWPLVDGFHTGPGVFSADGIDPGSALMVDTLPPLTGTGADLGAGWGVLSAKLLAASPKVRALHLVEDDHRALQSARLNVVDPRASFHWHDATTWAPAHKLDFVITNPPFHAGRSADPSIGRAFLTAAGGMLARHGRLWMVANRHLPYEAILGDLFQTVEERVVRNGYKVIEASMPRTGGSKAGGSKTGAAGTSTNSSNAVARRRR